MSKARMFRFALRSPVPSVSPICRLKSVPAATETPRSSLITTSCVDDVLISKRPSPVMLNGPTAKSIRGATDSAKMVSPPCRTSAAPPVMPISPKSPSCRLTSSAARKPVGSMSRSTAPRSSISMPSFSVTEPAPETRSVCAATSASSNTTSPLASRTTFLFSSVLIVLTLCAVFVVLNCSRNEPPISSTLATDRMELLAPFPVS